MTFLSNIAAKTAIAVSGLTLMTGLAAAPATIDQAAPATPDRAPVVQTDKAAPAKTDLVQEPQGAQQRFTPDSEQLANAREIVKAAEKQGLPDRAAVIGVATSLQESKLQNLGHLGERNDHDSQGLFQQRPSSGWGTAEQITDPEYAATAFYQGLKQVDGWQEMPLTDAAQTIQVSAYPDAYAQWEDMAADVVLATHGTGPYAHVK